MVVVLLRRLSSGVLSVVVWGYGGRGGGERHWMRAGGKSTETNFSSSGRNR